jgi:hypothetical protein
VTGFGSRANACEVDSTGETLPGRRSIPVVHRLAVKLVHFYPGVNTELAARFVKEDVDWGLKGND